MVLDSSGFDPSAFSDRIRYIRREAASRNRRNVFTRSLANLSWAVAAILLVGGGVLLFHPALIPALFEPPPFVLPEMPEVHGATDPTGLTGAVLPFEWVTIPAGKYLSGPPGAAWEVDLPAYQILKYEVSNEQWSVYLSDEETRLRKFNRYKDSVPRNWQWDPESGVPPLPPGDLWEKPVVYVTYSAAQDFCSWWLSKQRAAGGGAKFEGARLPTSQEWEKAARGGLVIPGPDGEWMHNPDPDRPYPWGTEFMGKDAFTGVSFFRCNVLESGGRQTVPVRWFYETDVSPYGVVGLAGNVAEFVKRSGGTPAYRGGTFLTDGLDARVHLETATQGDFTWNYVGFRAARSLPETE